MECQNQPPFQMIQANKPLVPRKMKVRKTSNNEFMMKTKKIRKRKHSNRQLSERRLKKLKPAKLNYLFKPGVLINKYPPFQFGNYRRCEKISIDIDQRLETIDKKYIKNKKVIDIGCGDGNLTLQIAKFYQPIQIIGLDLSKPLIRYANKCRQFLLNMHDFTNQSFNSVSNLKYIQSNFFIEQIEPESYQTVICINVLQYIGKTLGKDITEIFINKLYTILAKGGVCILRYKQMIESTNYKGEDKNEGLGHQSIQNKLTKVGFTIQSNKYQSLNRMISLVCVKN